MKKTLYTLLCFSIFFILLVSTAFAKGADFESGFVTATGIGARPSGETNAAAAVALARRAAVLDAYRNLAEYINGVKLDSETTVQNFANTNDIIKTKVSAVIKNAKIIEEHELNGGGYSVIMQIPIYGAKNSLASAIIKKESQIKEPLPAPIPNIKPSTPIDLPAEIPAKPTAIGGYTGVIIDCSGLGLDTAMSPVIKDANGRKIYGHKNLDPDQIIAKGMVSYSKGMTNIARAGAKPLVIKAIRVENHGINPAISLEDANRLLIENEVSHFLEATNVVFVR